MLAKNNIEIKTGANIIINTLQKLGVNTIFGYPGGIVLDLYDELYKQSEIKHILVRHEQSAMHAAEGYARTSGKCGVVLVTSGPGATNTVTGMMNAYLDGYPLVVITGQVFNKFIGKDAFQEANICDITKSCTKKTFQITDAREVEKSLQEAFKIANTGKKGPVLIDIVKDVFSQKIESLNDITQEEDVKNNVDTASIKRIFNEIKKSTNPVLLVGGGVRHSNSEEKVTKFAQFLNIPTVSTMMGLGCYDQNNKNYFGMIGIFGDKSANEILKQADLIISLGARLNDRITCMFDKNTFNKIIQIDINSNEINRNYTAKDFIIGDISEIITGFNNLCDVNLHNKFSSWTNFAQELKNLNKGNIKNSNMLHSFEVMEIIEDLTNNQNILFTSEVGQHLLWAVKNIKFNHNRKILVSGGSGTMGFGFPAAIGASIADKNKTIICITGDGSFQMGLHELATCKENNLNIKIIILNNGYLGMVRQLQEKNCEKRYSQTKITNPDFVKLAQSYGIEALRISSRDDMRAALNKALSTNGTFIIDAIVEPFEVV